MRKFITLLFLGTAYMIVLGHSFIPHHGHPEEYETHFAAPDHHHDNGNKEEDGILEHLFDNYSHASENYSVKQSGNTFFNPLVLTVALLPCNFSFDDILLPPVIHSNYISCISFSPPELLSFGLRAPPAL